LFIDSQNYNIAHLKRAGVNKMFISINKQILALLLIAYCSSLQAGGIFSKCGRSFKVDEKTINNNLHELILSNNTTELQKTLNAIPQDKRLMLLNQETGWGFLAQAVQYDKPECVKILIAMGANVDQQQEQSGWTALHSAADSNRTACIHILIQAGATLDLHNRDGWTPLHYAVFRPSSAELLLEYGASLTITTKESAGDIGKTFVELASKSMPKNYISNVIKNVIKNGLSHRQKRQQAFLPFIINAMINIPGWSKSLANNLCFIIGEYVIPTCTMEEMEQKAPKTQLVQAPQKPQAEPQNKDKKDPDINRCVIM